MNLTKGLLQLRKGAFDSVGYEEDFTALLFKHAFGDTVIEEGKERIVEAIDVE